MLIRLFPNPDLRKSDNSWKDSKRSISFPTGIDGGYTEWSKWSKCSATCGGGVQWQSRTCTNPVPEGSGKTCKEQGLGPAKQSKKCNTQPCGKLSLVAFMTHILMKSLSSFLIVVSCVHLSTLAFASLKIINTSIVFNWPMGVLSTSLRSCSQLLNLTLKPHSASPVGA